MAKPLALPVVPLVVHPVRPCVVWAVESRIFIYDLDQCLISHPLSSFAVRKTLERHTDVGPVRALDVYVGDEVRWLAAGAVAKRQSVL